MLQWTDVAYIVCNIFSHLAWGGWWMWHSTTFCFIQCHRLNICCSRRFLYNKVRQSMLPICILWESCKPLRGWYSMDVLRHQSPFEVLHWAKLTSTIKKKKVVHMCCTKELMKGKPLINHLLVCSLVLWWQTWFCCQLLLCYWALFIAFSFSKILTS